VGAVQAMVRAMVLISSTDLAGIVDSISQEVANMITEPEKVQAKHAIKVLVAMLSTTGKSIRKPRE
jgi:hypothetical protein